MARVKVGEETIEVDTVGARGFKPKRPDPTMLLEPNGSSRFYCPYDGKSLILLHAPSRHVFFACPRDDSKSKDEQCRFTLDGKKAEWLKNRVLASTMAFAAMKNVSAGSMPETREPRIVESLALPKPMQE
jgi:hypothetical protein